MSTANPMTLPSASSLTDEQLRVLAAEAAGYKLPFSVHSEWHENGDTEGFIEVLRDSSGRKFHDPLHDANAALPLLGEHWAANALSREEVSVAIFRPGKTYIGTAPDFCRAIVLSFLRAEGKIL